MPRSVLSPCFLCHLLKIGLSVVGLFAVDLFVADRAAVDPAVADHVAVVADRVVVAVVAAVASRPLQISLGLLAFETYQLPFLHVVAIDLID